MHPQTVRGDARRERLRLPGQPRVVQERRRRNLTAQTDFVKLGALSVVAMSPVVWIMISFLFWNVYNKSLDTHVARLVVRNDVDVVMLAECPDRPETILDSLNAISQERFTFPFSEGNRIRIFTRFPERTLVDWFNSNGDRLTIRRLRPHDETDLLLCVLHFQSRRTGWTESNQAVEATAIARDIADAEDRAFHQRTLLVGDMNMNPFDPGMLEARALNAVMTADLAKKETRKVSGSRYRFFYNPMWGLVGDRTPGPAGTHFYGSGLPSTTFWHMYDQVLIRPQLIDKLAEVTILDSDGEVPLVTQAGRPNKKSISDHLPILFRLDL